MVLTFSDAEEHIMSKILAALEGEPTMEHILKPSLDVLIFPNLEIHINEQTVYHNKHHVPLTHYEFFTLLYLVRAENVTFSMKDGFLRMTVFIGYFDKVY